MIFTMLEHENRLVSYMNTSNNRLDLFFILTIPFNYPSNLRKIFDWFKQDSIRRYKIIFDKELREINADLKQIHEFYPNIKTITVVTNPWDRIFRAFLHLRNDGKATVFENFVLELKDYDAEYQILKNQVDYIQYFDNENPILVDHIIRAENFEEDFKPIQEYFSTNLSISFQKPSPAYRALYTQKTKSIVEELFYKDIEFFKYSY